jgi:putative DNA primase/helicase
VSAQPAQRRRGNGPAAAGADDLPLATIAHQERYSDAGNARRLVRLFGDDIRWVPEIGWHWFDGVRWRRDDDGELERKAKQVPAAIISGSEHYPREMREEAVKFALRSEQAPRLQAMIDLARSEPGIHLSRNALDVDPWLAGIDAGAIDLRTGERIMAPRQTYITRRLGPAYRPHDKCPTWCAFLDRIMDADVDLIGFLQRAIGYTLTGNVSEQCVVILHGPGANGKSVFLRTVRELLGDYGADASIDTFLDRRDRDSSNDLARLAGTRFVCASELDEGKRLGEALIKTLTGGEAIAARFLFREYFEFNPTFKVWIAVNHKPTIRGDDLGIWRRIRLVPFRETIPPAEQDLELLEKLRRELPGILNWAIHGAVAWREVGLAPPAAVVEATAIYRAESDAIGEWLQERCVVSDGASVQAKLLYDDYHRFIQDRGAAPLSMKRWAQRMADRGFTKDEGRLVHYRGIGLCDLREGCDQFPEPSPYARTRGDLPEKGREGRNGRKDFFEVGQ